MIARQINDKAMQAITVTVGPCKYACVAVAWTIYELHFRVQVVRLYVAVVCIQSAAAGTEN